MDFYREQIEYLLNFNTLYVPSGHYIIHRIIHFPYSLIPIQGHIEAVTGYPTEH